MSAETAVITALMVVVFLVVVAAMLASGTGHAGTDHGRHRRGARRWLRVDTPDVFDRVLASAGGGGAGAVLSFLTVVADLDPDVLPFAPGPDYCDEPDDWTADLPTDQLAAVVDAPRHTSPSERARQRWGVECPIFAQLADQWGYTLGGDLNPELVAA